MSRRKSPRVTTIRRMSHSRRGKLRAPQLPERYQVVKSVRFSLDTARRIELARGELEASAWIRNVIDRELENPEERAIRDCEEYCKRRGVTPEMMIRFRERQAK